MSWQVPWASTWSIIDARAGSSSPADFRAASNIGLV
jgi:hypothetical protein